MAMRILARDGGGTYIIGDGDPKKDPMMLSQAVSLDGYLYPAKPFLSHLKWGEFDLCPDDPVLLQKLLARPKAPDHGGVP